MNRKELNSLVNSPAYNLKEDISRLAEQAFKDARIYAEEGNVPEAVLRIAATRFFEERLSVDLPRISLNTEVSLLLIAEGAYLSTFESYQLPDRPGHVTRFHSLMSIIEL